MDEYIKRETAISLVQPDTPEDEKAVVTIATAKKLIRSVLHRTPAADVAPVVHGRWEDSIDEWFETDVYTCSKCRESYVLVEGTPKENLWHYCPNCGAKMDGGADDEM